MLVFHDTQGGFDEARFRHMAPLQQSVAALFLALICSASGAAPKIDEGIMKLPI